MLKIKKFQQGGNLLAINKPLPISNTPEAPAKLNAMDALKMYSDYTKLKSRSVQDSERTYRDNVANSFQKYNGKQITNYFDDSQKQNVQNLQANGQHTSFCMAGTCKVLSDAGDTFKGDGNIDGIYFGNETAQQNLKGDGFIPTKDATSFKRGDILQILGNDKGRNYPNHAMAFDSYIKDATGNNVGMRAFENYGDGNQKFVDIVDNPSLVNKGDSSSSITYKELLQNYNPNTPLAQGQHGLQAWTKDPEQFKQKNIQALQDHETQLNTLKQKLTEFNPALADDNKAKQYFGGINRELPKKQQLALYSDGGLLQEANTATIKINNKKYIVELAITDEEKAKGLQGVEYLPLDEGMLFVYDKSEHVSYWMKDTHIPLDIIFIDEDWEIKAIFHGEPENEEMFELNDVKYVLELNSNSGLVVGDEVDLSDIDEDDDITKMMVLDENGESQMDLVGGERIFSRPNTLTLVRLAKRAHISEDDKHYKALGRKAFKYLNIQNNKEDDYVELPD